MKINEDRKAYIKHIHALDSIHFLDSARLDLCDRKVATYIAGEDSYKSSLRLQKDKAALSQEELELQKKKTNKANLRAIFIAVGGALVEALTLYALIAK